MRAVTGQAAAVGVDGVTENDVVTASAAAEVNIEEWSGEMQEETAAAAQGVDPTSEMIADNHIGLGAYRPIRKIERQTSVEPALV